MSSAKLSYSKNSLPLIEPDYPILQISGSHGGKCIDYHIQGLHDTAR